MRKQFAGWNCAGLRSLKNTDPDFDQAFAALLAEKREVSEEVDGVVSGIIKDVRTRGDAALIEISRKFDRIELDEAGIAVSPDEVAEAVQRTKKETPDALEALNFAYSRIFAHHQRQKAPNSANAGLR